MKKIYTTCFLLITSVALGMAQGLPEFQVMPLEMRTTSETPVERATVPVSKIPKVDLSSRGGGSCVLTEDFEGGSFPGTWLSQQTNQNQTWQYSATGGNPDGMMVIYYDQTTAAQYETIVTPFLDLTTLAAPVLTFDWQMSYYWGVSPYDLYDFTVAVSTDFGNTFTAVWTESDEGVFSSGVWYNKTIDLSAYSSSSSVLIAFNYDGADGDYIRLDNVNVCSQAANDLVVDKVILGDPLNDYVYSRVPVTLTSEVMVGAVVRNVGSVAQTGINVDLGLYSYNAAGFVSGGNLNGPASLAPGATDTIWASSGYTPSAIDTLEAYAEVFADQTDEDPSNNVNYAGPNYITAETWAHDVTSESYYARGYAASSGPVGNQNFELGAQFYCQTSGSTLYAAQFALADATTAQTVIIKVYEGTSLVSETIYDIQPGDLSVNSVVWINVPLDDVVPMIDGNVYLLTVDFQGGDDGYLLANNFSNYDASQLVYFELNDTWYIWPNVLSTMRALVSYAVDVPEESALNSVVVYPNPAQDVVNVNFTSEIDQDVLINLIGVNGALVSSRQINASSGKSTSFDLNVAGLSAGVYTVQFIAENVTMTQRIAVQ